MPRRSPHATLPVYLALFAGSFLFMVPFLWMVSTALKPIDQTMTMPPTWIPYTWHTILDAKKTEVRILATLTEPVAVVTDSSGTRRLVPVSALAGNLLLQNAGSGPPDSIPVTVVSTVEATREKPWVQVAAYRENPADASWFLRPADKLTRSVALRWSNFIEAIRAMGHFPRYLGNTLLLCFLTVTGTVFSSSLAAYGFARIPWRGRNKVFIVLLATMMIPFPVVMVPLFSLFRHLRWIGTFKPLWVHTFCAAAFNVFLLRQFFMTIPRELSEAARMDGCSELDIYLRIILPLSRPALMVVGLFQFMATWNDFLGPLIFLTDQKMYTLALGLQFFQSQHGGTEWHYLMAASTLVVLPVIGLFFFTQKTFIEGISMTGIKG